MTGPDPLTLYERLMAVRPASLSANAWAVRAEVNRSVFNDIRKRDRANHETLRKLLSAIGVTFADFEAGVKAVGKDAAPIEAAEKAPIVAIRGDDRPRDVPLVGTAECGDVDFAADGEMVPVETMEVDFDNVVDHVRRPASLDNKRDVYAIYYRGNSMAPRYEPGEIGYVDPSRPPRIMEYVVLQLRRPDEHDGERVCRVLAKRLVRMTSAYVELEQFNPHIIFRVNRAEVKHLHRIIPWDELVSF